MCVSTSVTPNTVPKPSGSVPDIVPSDEISQAAYKYASEHLHPSILNHSIRVFVHAQNLASCEASEWNTPPRLSLLFAACILHDIGASSPHDGPQRFEVEGADAAVTLLRNFIQDARDLHEVWVAIAIHTSPGIAERITSLARLVRIGVAIDFNRHASSSKSFASPEDIERAERVFPRLDIEKVLGDAVVEQALRRPEKAPTASWPGVLLRSAQENPGWEGVNKAF